MESKGPCKLYCTGLFMLIVDSLLLSVRWSMSLKLNHIKNLCSSYSLVFVFSFCVNVFNFFFFLILLKHLVLVLAVFCASAGLSCLIGFRPFHSTTNNRLEYIFLSERCQHWRNATKSILLPAAAGYNN